MPEELIALAVMFGVVLFIFLGVIPAILWCYDKINLVRRRRRVFRAMMIAVSNHLMTANEARRYGG
jgi:hypothetical protein